MNNRLSSAFSACDGLMRVLHSEAACVASLSYQKKYNDVSKQLHVYGFVICNMYK